MQRRWWAAVAAIGAVACAAGPDEGPGVSLSLARHRAATVAGIAYDLHFDVPRDATAPVHGTVDVSFSLDAPADVLLDFRPADGSVGQVVVNDTPTDVVWRDGHIRLPAALLAAGENAVHVAFVAGNGALNRNPDFLYTLFVPDRASTAFPSFDQPNLKAVYRLSLTVPDDWQAVANGSALTDTVIDGRRHLRFTETHPLPTYVAAFIAGRFQVETATRDGRTMRLFHRETDTVRIAANLDAVFDLHATALAWLEEYTGIPYPFEKMDFVAIPAFQFGAMEHPGAIVYRANGLFLDDPPTPNALLARASRIAHETAHMWFGNLVTMTWFNDVWMKEVFANFMAAKIVNPTFPAIDHELRFFLAHHPQAYDIDRTAGANAIRQDLDNLLEAGTLYGAIIYQKAPVVMRQLETLVGREAFRNGIREYLLAHQYANAGWPDLIAILDRLTDVDLFEWSAAWVDTPGRPTVEWDAMRDRGFLAASTVRQHDPRARDVWWLQDVTLALGYPDSVVQAPIRLDQGEVQLGHLDGTAAPTWVLVGAEGMGYGHFRLDETSRNALVNGLGSVEPAVTRAVAWMGLWEAMLEHDLEPATLIDVGLRVLSDEPDDLLVQRILNDVREAYWQHLDADDRAAVAPQLEAVLWRELREAGQSAGRRAALFDASVGIASTPTAVTRLDDLWQGNRSIPGLPITETRRSLLAQELAVRGVPRALDVLEAQLASITNPDRRAAFAFVLPALHPDSAVRDSVFASFADLANRRQERWVLAATRYLNHPLRAAQSEHYIGPGLALVEEIQATGDIFFPLRWLNALLNGHRTRSAAAAVQRFLDERPRYPARLEGKILQAADPLLRASYLR
jgi:aminopeptidase N